MLTIGAAVLLATSAGVGYVLWASQRVPPPGETGALLEAMAQKDQAMREAGFDGLWSALTWKYKDWRRVRRVRSIVEADQLSTANDYRRAAFILQHGSATSDYALARDLAATAVELGDDRARHLQALAEDRYRLSNGEPQKYGSQLQCSSDEGWTLEPLDDTTTDAEREAVGIPPLAELRRRVDRINEITGGSCSLDAAQMKMLEQIMRPPEEEPLAESPDR